MTPRRFGADALLGGTALLCIAAVGAALATQYGLGMEPCPWCVLQRVIFLAIALACVIGLVWRARAGRIVAALLALLLAASGMAAALWQHFVAAASASCKLTLADQIVSGIGLDSLWPDVFSARATCADAAVRLIGVPYEFWSLALFIACAAAALTVLGRAR